MRANEFIIEAPLTRRGFLGTLGAGAAMAAAPGLSQAGEYQGIGDFGSTRFMKEADKLEKRIGPIFQKLVAASGKDANLLSKIKVSAESVTGGAEAALDDGKIIMDVTVFHDLSDDAIAYTLAHEMGHLVYKHRFKGISTQQARQYELAADVYGARLAYKCGYNPREAYAEMTDAEKRAKAKPNAQHPDYQTRKTHVQQQTGIPVASINSLQHNRQAIRNFMLA